MEEAMAGKKPDQVGEEAKKALEQLRELKPKLPR